MVVYLQQMELDYTDKTQTQQFGLMAHQQRIQIMLFGIHTTALVQLPEEQLIVDLMEYIGIHIKEFTFEAD